MSINVSYKVSDEGIDFLRRFCSNYYLVHNITIYPWEALELIEKYFKGNNIEYQEAIKMEKSKND